MKNPSREVAVSRRSRNVCERTQGPKDPRTQGPKDPAEAWSERVIGAFPPVAWYSKRRWDCESIRVNVNALPIVRIPFPEPRPATHHSG